ncbi:YjbH domain-containing protein [Jannaschia pohangensis]|uniref:Exopolysaccharide biosynthesis protein YbjH n=1 Tax=Jannaschia pohangensis TaxID=390807 RepID=A0A1I3U8X2_9RHOB|nr:YjbH domain-containing protein [Jannaschia pohangensis]SFJ79372.1 Exopolysaccharide biosynthesis protein YbjH [Jannaschia pohangensis]
MTTLSKAVAIAFAALALPAAAQDIRAINSYGVPGLIDLPTAQMQPDAELTTSLTLLSNGSGRTQIAFQLTPRLQAVFRYATVPDFLPIGPNFVRTYDRSFDLRYQLLTETARRPAVTVGIQDIGGTSLYASEYVVATKSFGDRWTVTGGLGWGRLGTRGGFTNPLGIVSDKFETRPPLTIGTGGQFQTSQIFRGDAALFGGVQYRWNDRLTLTAEYSSDAYVEEEARGIFDAKTPLNFGFDYRLRPGTSLSGYVLHGSEVGVTLQFSLNPKRSPVGSGIGPAAPPVTLRPAPQDDPAAWDAAWTQNPSAPVILRAGLGTVMADAGLPLVASKIEGSRAEIHFRNPIYGAQPQAIGRAARAATAVLPASVETLVFVPLNEAGLAGDAVVLRRSDIEALENSPNGADELLAVAGLVDAARLDRAGLVVQPDAYPRFQWALGPYVAVSTFDPDNPLRLDLGAELSASYQPVAGLMFEGALRQRIVGNRDGSTRPSDSVLPRVRSESNLFARTDKPFIPYLTGTYMFRPGPNLYGRVSAGLLEPQFGGVSGELLWKPSGSRLALGVEVSKVRQRDFDMQLGFQDLEATTAFVSAYYNHGNGFHSQVDVGQYLAGDRGLTYELAREFANGWRVSAYATKTNVSAAEFGEGSFDKGIRLRVPFSWFTGQPTQTSGNVLVQPILRDGGARLNLRNRLYPLVRDQSAPDLTDDWGTVWR